MQSESQKIKRVLEIFKASKAAIRPHFIVVGSSGSGKSYTMQQLTELVGLDYLEINAAQLTKEGTSGNSLSKALTPLLNKTQKLTICFVDEFDKLFISGNSNSSLAHETTNGVQNEFLKVLESGQASVYGEYGKYVNTPVDKVLFVFAGAFNGEENITLDRLRDFGVKTEFLGRAGILFNLRRLTIEELLEILNNSVLLNEYLQLFPAADRNHCISLLSSYIVNTYDQNTLGARIVNSLIHQYFINGGVLSQVEVEKTSFQTTLQM